MKTRQFFAWAGMGVLAVGSSCQKKGDATPADGATTGRLVKMELAFECSGQASRPRWLVDVAPVMLAGYQATLYSQAKVFNLPADVAYKVGQVIPSTTSSCPTISKRPGKRGTSGGRSSKTGWGHCIA